MDWDGGSGVGAAGTGGVVAEGAADGPGMVPFKLHPPTSASAEITVSMRNIFFISRIIKSNSIYYILFTAFITLQILSDRIRLFGIF